MATEQDHIGELDYRITFPSPSGKTFTGESSDQEEPTSIEPVVILLGWVGCQEKHLAKYAQIWEQKR